jgi:hypothetical protein
VRILEKFNEDAGYSQMREDLNTRLPSLERTLHGLSSTVPRDQVKRPWSTIEENDVIIPQIIAVIRGWDNRTVWWVTFDKMLRSMGNPTSGVVAGSNFNEEIAATMRPFPGRWNTAMRA